VRRHRRRPREAWTRRQQLLDDRRRAIRVREKRLVLKADVREAMTLPEPVQLGRHAQRLEAEPRAAVHGGIGAERAAEAAALRGNVIELPLAFQREVALDVD